MLQKAMDTYKRMEFNGCFGSIDGTYVMRNQCVEEYLYWQREVPHLGIFDYDKSVMCVSKAFLGAANDKTILKSVPESVALIRGFMKDVVFALYDG